MELVQMWINLHLLPISLHFFCFHLKNFLPGSGSAALKKGCKNEQKLQLHTVRGYGAKIGNYGVGPTKELRLLKTLLQELYTVQFSNEAARGLDFATNCSKRFLRKQCNWKKLICNECFATRVATKQPFWNFAKHEIVTKFFWISRNFAKIKS